LHHILFNSIFFNETTLFGIASESTFSKLFDRMDQHQDIFSKIMGDNDFAEVVKDWMLKKVCDRLNKDAD
jgi:hypothetical protein